MEIAVLSGRKAEKSTKEVLGYLKKQSNGLEVKEVPADIVNFRNGELNIKLLGSVRSSDVIIFQQFTQPGSEIHEEIFELMLLCDTAARAAANSITLCLPFIPYLRQDRKAEGREPISAKVLFNLIQKSCSGKLSRIVTFDMHNPAEQGFVDLPLDNIPAMPTFAEFFVKQKWFDQKNTVVLAPDAGSAKKAEKLSGCLGLEDGVAIVHKERKKGEMAKAKSIIGNVQGKQVLIIDDMIDSGGTIMAAAELARENDASDIHVAGTHGIFSNDAEKKFSELKIKVITTDCIPKDENYIKSNKDWLTTLSVAEYTAEVIRENAVGGSVSSVIEKQLRRCCPTCR